MNKHLTQVIAEAGAVFFDLFHTLTGLPSQVAPGRETSEILGVRRKDWSDLLFNDSDARLRGQLSDPVEIIRQLARRLNPGVTDEAIREAVESRQRRFRQALIRISPKNVATLQSLKHAGKKIALISNADAAEVSAWHESPLAEVFDSTLFSCDVGFVKPEKEIYEVGLRALSVRPEETVFVGDGGCQELKGAKEVGLTTVMTTEIMQHLWPEEIEKRRPFADFVIDRLEALAIP